MRINMAFVLVFLVLGSCSSSKKLQEPLPRDTPPNVLFIAVDDLKPLMGCYGNSDIKTPNIDKLASRGYLFLNNHCQQAVCAPSRASLLTGKRPDYTQIWDLKTLIRDRRPDVVTLPQYFTQNGYVTVGIGKIFDYRSVDKGADSISWSVPYENIKGKEYVKATKKVFYEVTDIDDTATLDGKVATKAIENLRAFKKSGKPFFLATGFYKPHLPFVVPKRYWDMYDYNAISLPPFQKAPVGAPAFATQPGWELRSGYDNVPKENNVPIPVEMQKTLIHGYYASVSFIDQQIGKVLDELDYLGLSQNTIIVLWGDHGWHLGDHDIWCKHTNYEQATRSPLIFSFGNKLNGKSNSPTEFVDIFPTLCKLANLPIPSNLDGMDLSDVLFGKSKNTKPYAVSQFPRDNDKMGYAFRNERYRYIVWLKNFKTSDDFDSSQIVAEELYDYQTDALETTNLINAVSHQNALTEMRHFMKDYFIKQKSNQ